MLRIQRCTELSFVLGREIYKGEPDFMEILSIGDLPIMLICINFVAAM